MIARNREHERPKIRRIFLLVSRLSSRSRASPVSFFTIEKLISATTQVLEFVSRYFRRDVRKQEGISGNNRLNAHTQVRVRVFLLLFPCKKRGNIFSRKEVERSERGFPPFILTEKELKFSLEKEKRPASSRGQVRAKKEGRKGSSSTNLGENLGGGGEREKERERTSHSDKDDFLESRLFLSPCLCAILLFLAVQRYTQGGIERRGKRKVAENRGETIRGWLEREERKRWKEDSKTAPLIRRLGSDVPIFREQYR